MIESDLESLEDAVQRTINLLRDYEKIGEEAED